MIRPLGVVHFTIGVHDIERSTRFYVDVLGMSVVKRFERMTFLRCGQDDLILAQTTEPVGTADRTGESVHHAFRVAPENYDEALATLEANGSAPFLIEKRERGVFVGRSAYFTDPDNNVLELHDGA